jgi:hypothetical protein
MTEPVYERGVWCFWLAADDPILQYVSHLNCVLAVSYMAPSFAQRPQGRALVAINPRYDYEEVWLWLDDLLAAETQAIHLGEAWEVAINSACDEGLSDEWDS